MVTATQIQKVLEAHPEGLKGRQIADILNADKKNVNSILYRNKGKLFIQDEDYVWRVKSDKKKTSSVSVQKTVNKSSQSNILEKTKPVILDHISVSGCNDHRPNIGKVIKNRRFVKQRICDIPAKLRYRPHEIDGIQVCLEKSGKYYRVGYIPEDMKQYFMNHIDDIGMTANINRFYDLYSITLNVPFVIRSVQGGLPEAAPIRQPSIVQKMNYHPMTARSKIDAVPNSKTDIATRKAGIQDSSVQPDAVIDVSFIEKRKQNRILDFIDGHKFAASLMVIIILFFGKNALDDARSDNYIRTSILTKEYIYRTYKPDMYFTKTLKGSVGDEWKVGKVDVYVNGLLASDDTITIQPGDTLEFEGYVKESDPSWDDYGYFSEVMYRVTQDSLQGKIKVPVQNIEVKENGGRYSGAIAHIDVMITLTPIN